MSTPRDAVVGGGIMGLALARALARRGRQVTLFDADDPPEGASLRNFGTLWPIGQPAGWRRTLALRSLGLWREVLTEADVWSAACGSLHVARHGDELALLEDFTALATAHGAAYRLLTPREALRCAPALRADGLLAALWSPDEMQIAPRRALPGIRAGLARRWHVAIELGVRVTACGGGQVRAGERCWPADRVWIAGGADLRTLYPEQCAGLGLRRCKLQMAATAPAPWRLGPILAGGLTLAHYESFAGLPGLPALRRRLTADWPQQVAAGVHVLVAQHEDGRLIIGDSHAYDHEVTPFDAAAIEDLIWTYLRTFVGAELPPIAERWHGIYVKHPRAPFVAWSPERGVTAVTGLGGHGMTLSFGLAEELVDATLTA